MTYGSSLKREQRRTQLPPGQRLIDGFPRFGAQLSGPPPTVPLNPVIQIRGAITEPFDVRIAELETLPRREMVADFHCVAGWSATDLRWEGVSFRTFYRSLIEPALQPGVAVTHVVCRGLDGWRSVLAINDALADDVLLADRLDGHPLDADHGAPIRLVSPLQYGYLNTKHLSRITVHTAEPTGVHRGVLRLLGPHPRGRVWQEERHRHLPAWALRRIYRATVKPLLRRR